VDETLWRKIEPTTAKPRKRLEAMRVLREHGIRSGVFLSPVLPGITDGGDHLEAVIAAAAEAGADFVFSQALRLGPGISEYYLPFLAREFPELVGRYRRLYHGNSPPGAYSEAVQRTVRELKTRYGIAGGMPAVKAADPVPVQLQLLG
jgi:DNA repair photolyase